MTRRFLSYGFCVTAITLSAAVAVAGSTGEEQFGEGDCTVTVLSGSGSEPKRVSGGKALALDEC